MESFFLFSEKLRLIAAVSLCLLILCFIPGDASCLDLTDKNVLIIGNFCTEKSGENLPAGWETLLFKKIEKHTLYSRVRDNGCFVIKAEANASASALIRKTSINLNKYPIVNWRWKVSNILEKGDIHSKSGDDYPARVYITFEYDPAKLSLWERSKYELARLVYGQYPPYAAINYIWGSHAPKGTLSPNPYTNRTMMYVVESGDEKLNRWIEEERDVYKDYKKAFGTEPPMVSGVAIMTDTDNTGEKATAFFGDIIFKDKGK
ncbi:DUF3047 domain-containing protein [Desulfobacterium sp. N47]|uniref:DUF3047 domain-containing protein n=1 Tax=uncultured Desulfobacterium sp. TaxID=201089 RepID=E1YE47_9BACT|nr:hypothetical protein N47_B19520 [uncultured Desulfobacterium sp.]